MKKHRTMVGHVLPVWIHQSVPNPFLIVSFGPVLLIHCLAAQDLGQVSRSRSNPVSQLQLSTVTFCSITDLDDINPNYLSLQYHCTRRLHTQSTF